MTEARVRAYIAFSVIGFFFVFMLVILLGFADIQDPTIAKVVGTLVGYITALLNPIIMRYFREPVQVQAPSTETNDG